MKMLVFMIICVVLVNAAGAGLLFWEIHSRPEQYGLGESPGKLTGTLIYGGCMAALASGISVFVFLFYEDSTFLSVLKRAVVLALLWPVAYTDFITFRIPNRFIGGGLLARLAVLAAELMLLDRESLLPTLVSDGAAGLAFFTTAALCAVVARNSIGPGDMKLFFVMGIFLGLQGTWGAVFLSLIISFAAAVALLAAKKKSRKDAIPFGPALMAGTYLSVFLTGM